MAQDPRFLNQAFSTENVQSYLTDYASTLQKVLAGVPAAALEAAAQTLTESRQNGARLFAAGNGGSAAISEHLSCDWSKGVHLEGHKALNVQCLPSNTALMTAIANDFGYEKSFAFQLELAELSPKDVVLLLSCSGNSPNVVAAAEYAKAKGAKVIGFTGFEGGKLKKLSDVSLHIPVNNYGLVEDAHQMLMHVLAQYHDFKLRE